MNNVICEIKTSGPYLISVSYIINKDCSAKIIRHKWLDGYFKDPNNFRTWKNKYELIDLGEFTLKKDDLIDIRNKWADSNVMKPLIIGSVEKEGYGSDKYYITFDKENCYSILNDYFTDR